MPRSAITIALRAATVALPALTAAACTLTTEPLPAGPAGAPPVTARVEGNWVDPNGPGIATFQNGAFVTRAKDTGNPFTTGGRYTYAGGNRVAITYTSLSQQRVVRVNCDVVGASRLNCTNDGGTNFTLVRNA